MALFAFGKQCPRCTSGAVKRMEREGWMRLIPGSKYYRCGKCRTRMLIFGDKLTIKLP